MAHAKGCTEWIASATCYVAHVLSYVQRTLCYHATTLFNIVVGIAIVVVPVPRVVGFPCCLRRCANRTKDQASRCQLLNARGISSEISLSKQGFGASISPPHSQTHKHTRAHTHSTHAHKHMHAHAHARTHAQHARTAKHAHLLAAAGRWYCKHRASFEILAFINHLRGRKFPAGSFIRISFICVDTVHIHKHVRNIT